MDFDLGEDFAEDFAEGPRAHTATNKLDQQGKPEKKEKEKEKDKKGTKSGVQTKYVPPKINVKTPPPPAPVGKPLPLAAKSEPWRQPQSEAKPQTVYKAIHKQQQQYQQPPQQHQQQVDPSQYLHNLDKNPMTNREKFMLYKVQRVEGKLEKTTAQLQKFRSGYQNLVRSRALSWHTQLI